MSNRTMIQATPSRIRHKDKNQPTEWGVRVEGEAPNLGDTVEVTARNGKSWKAVIEKIVWAGNRGGRMVHLFTTKQTFDVIGEAERHKGLLSSEETRFRYGMVVEFKAGLDRETCESAVKHLKRLGLVEEVPTIHDFNPDHGGPVWYIP